MARALGLPHEPSREELTPHLSRMSFSGSGEDASVALFVSNGAGHTWPGSRLPHRASGGR